MRILELQMKHFGKFSDARVTFHEGLNVICGENEMGKTTMHSFIRGMLFGIEKQRGRAAKNDEYSLRQPWENGGYYAGALRFESGGKIFRIERSFHRKEKSASLVCETDGEELSLEDGDLESLMEGMNEEAFINTVFIRQKGSETGAGLAAELRNFMTNLQSAKDGELDVNQALSRLEKKGRKLEAEHKQQLACDTKRLQEVQMRLDYADQELEGRRQELEECRIRKNQLDTELKLAREQEARESRLEQAAKGLHTEPKQHFLILLLGLAALLGSIFVPEMILKGLLLLAWLTLFGLYLLEKRKRGKDRQASEPGAFMDEAGIRRRKLGEARGRARWEEERLLEELRENQTIRDNLMEAREELLAEDTDAERQEEIGALRLASETIKSLSDEIYQETAKSLNERISEILCEITGGRYTSVFLDARMEVRINTPQKLLSLEQVSRGTMDQIYFALRMAAGEMLSGGVPMPILLDDAFAMYDDERLERTLSWLKKSKRQVILFTCQRREKELLDRD